MAVSEAILQEQVADYLRLQYPQVVFHSDTGSITRLTPRQGARRKRQNGGRRAWPDMFIAEPALSTDIRLIRAGLFIELKKEGRQVGVRAYRRASRNARYPRIQRLQGGILRWF